MSVTVKEWEENFKTLDTKQQQAIVNGLLALSEWPLFKEQYKDSGLFQLAVGLSVIAYGKLEQHVVNLLQD